MKLINRFFVFLLLTSLSYTSSLAQDNKAYFLHTIEKGQSLYSIAQMYNVTTTDIIRLNPGCDEKIYSGQNLKIPQGKESQRGEKFHTIQAGETLYKLTTLYNISAKKICDANPGLSAENFRIGQVILIPTEAGSTTQQAATPLTQPTIQGPVVARCKDMHRVKRKETLFSVSREYEITEQELIAANPELKNGMQKGQLLCIPYGEARIMQPSAKVEAIVQTPPSNNELFNKNKENVRTISTIKAAIILPFKEDKRMVEYYEGFLMAVDSLKRTGTSLDLYVYDSGKDIATLNTLLTKSVMKQMDVIFGPMHADQIKPLATFAKKNNIRLVIPFSQKGEEVFNTPSIYQINTPQSYLYSEVYEHYLRQFPNSNVIFVEATNGDKEKKEFIDGLKQELKRKGIAMQSVNENATSKMLRETIDIDRHNVFIPTSGKNSLLIKFLPQLRLLVRENENIIIHLFGYPEWQTYTRDHLDSFFEVDTYFYSSFYMNSMFPAAVQFAKNYYKWYSKDLASKFPNYSMLGFDTGYFFLKGLTRYGSELENNLEKMDLTSIQTGFSFKRVNNWGGFINKKVFFIHFTKENELVKLDFE